ncbi:MAG: hypothetical protein ABSG91_12685 [Syntrophobacteraceae bacterium]|jgi:vacuolar-type H+-ATPase subunit H
MGTFKADKIIKELKELRDASSKGAVESAARRVEEILQELESKTAKPKAV